MIRNYIKIAWRSLLKNKAYNALNICGLAIGITCASFILLWVEDEVNFDLSIADAENVYYVPTNQKYEGEWRTFYSTPGPLAQALEDEIPEISHAARQFNTNFMFSIDGQGINSRGAFSDADIFDIFGLKFIKGNPQVAFNNKDAIVLTQSTAKQLFGARQDILGKTVEVNKSENYTVTGIIEDLPESTTFNFNWLVPFENLTDGREWTQKYGSNYANTFVKLVPGSDPGAVNGKVKRIIPEKTGEEGTEAILFSAKNWHLRSDFKNGKIVGGRIEYINLFSLIAIIILTIACINFMNLATARSEKRANEVGVRKTLGSDKKQLMFQFMAEAFMIASLAAILSVILLIILLPLFNGLVDKHLSLGLANPMHYLSLIAIAALCGFVAGLYPAVYLSSFKPIDVLKGKKSSSRNAAFIRKGLVIAQFVVSITFIISTVIVYQQVSYVKNRNLGMNKENLIELPVNGTMLKNLAPLKQSLTSSGMIKSVGVTNSQALEGGNNGSGLNWQGGQDTEDVLISYRYVNDDFIKTMGMQLVEGRGFGSVTENDSLSTIITQSFANLMEKGSALGKKITRGDTEYVVQGVIKDFVYGDMYSGSDPVMFFNTPANAEYMYLRTNPKYPIDQIINKVESDLKTYNPGFPFEYRFLDEVFDNRFKSEQLIGELSQVFAILAIIISCLGLFGLSAYTAEQRKKEIGVRKVLGSSVTGIVRLLSKDFIFLVFIAILIAVPLAWYVMNNWLQGFSYRISINGWVFAFAGITAIIIALVTVSFQAIKAAMANPVKSLRTE
ncbi:MAG: acetylornithine deacetylase [Cytophagaceae bacterium]|nr:acetylornithine deacetylase [Cytophagaceae bacterium]|tara:strand:+ start:5073 stop:7427 length:2355 start_codon:yes stop_codon:yes gene_type:complete